MNANQTYRVVRLSTSTREGIKAARDKSGRNNATIIADAIDNQLPRVTESLKQLGFTKDRGKTKPFRLPFADDRGTLAALRDASDELGVPAIHLLLISLAGELGTTAPKAKRAKTRKGSSKKGGR